MAWIGVLETGSSVTQFLQSVGYIGRNRRLRGQEADRIAIEQLVDVVGKGDASRSPYRSSTS